MAAMIHRTVTIAPHLPRRCPEPRDFDARTGRDEPDSRAAEPAWPKAPTSKGRLAAGRPPHREVNRDHDRIHGHPGQPQMRPLPQHRTIGSSGHPFLPRVRSLRTGRRQLRSNGTDNRQGHYQRPDRGLVRRAERLCRLPLPGQKRHLPGQGSPARRGCVGDLHGDRLTGRLAEAT
jgi:hypothetical protein